MVLLMFFSSVLYPSPTQGVPFLGSLNVGTKTRSTVLTSTVDSYGDLETGRPYLWTLQFSLRTQVLIKKIYQVDSD